MVNKSITIRLTRICELFFELLDFEVVCSRSISTQIGQSSFFISNFFFGLGVITNLTLKFNGFGQRIQDFFIGIRNCIRKLLISINYFLVCFYECFVNAFLKLKISIFFSIFDFFDLVFNVADFIFDVFN